MRRLSIGRRIEVQRFCRCTPQALRMSTSPAVCAAHDGHCLMIVLSACFHHAHLLCSIGHLARYRHLQPIDCLGRFISNMRWLDCRHTCSGTGVATSRC